MPKIELSKENIVAILESKHPQSLTEVYRHLGGQGKLSGSVAKKMRLLVEGIDNWVANNKGDAGSVKAEGESKGNKATVQKSGKPKSVKKASKPNKYPRIQANPFRTNSNYALAYDVLAAYPDGLPLATWRELYAKAAGKSLKLACYDIQVLLTAKDTPNGERHRSCRSGFYIERQCDHVTLKF